MSAVTMGIAAGAGQIGMFHHDPEHDDQALDRIASAAGQMAAKKGSSSVVLCLREGRELPI